MTIDQIDISNVIKSFHKYIIDNSKTVKTLLDTISIDQIKYTCYAKYLVESKNSTKNAFENYSSNRVINKVVIDSNGILLHGFDTIILAMTQGITEIPVIRKNVNLRRYGVIILDKIPFDTKYLEISAIRSSRGKAFYSKEAREIMQEQSGRCPICGVQVTLDKSKAQNGLYRYSKLVLIKPEYLGGEQVRDNKILLCTRCAHLKGDLDLNPSVVSVIKQQRAIEESLGIELNQFYSG